MPAKMERSVERGRFVVGEGKVRRRGGRRAVQRLRTGSIHGSRDSAILLGKTFTKVLV